MPKTQTSCPRCRQPIVADLEQLFDISADPQAKQRLLSGMVNAARCPSCGYEGMLSVPIVYHDPDKELLLTYFPPELGLPLNEQERLIGPMIKQTVNRLPNEKRKAYILQPQTMFTMQTMMQRILEADGITKEMLENQQKQVAFLERLLAATEVSRPEIIKNEEGLVDQNMFMILSRILESAMSQGNEQIARQLAAVQQDLLQHTKIGQELQLQAKESEDVYKALQEASKDGLTREKLLDLAVKNAASDSGLATLVSVTRGGMDYSFFEMLTTRITSADTAEAEKLKALREKMLQLTNEVDQAMQKEMEQSRGILEKILSAPNIEEATLQNVENLSDLFVQVLKSELDAARQKGDLERSGKIQQVISILQKVSTPPELEFIQTLLKAKSDEERQKLFEQNSAQLTQEFFQLLNGLIHQSTEQKQPQEIVDGLSEIYRSGLRFSMQMNLNK